jgi:glycosyltransferase involved in cell wall biosynthesis
VSVEKAAEMSYRFAAAQLALSKDDFVLMNTVAVNDCYREVVLNMLDTGRLTQAHWFIHEDEAQLKVVKGVIEEPHLRDKISKLVNEEKLHVFVPAKRVKKFYDKLFDTKKVHAVPLQLDVPKKLQTAKKEKDFNKLDFLLTGASSDGRKGQLIVLAALQAFLLKYQSKNPSEYRDFSVHFISIGSDYVSTQVKTIGSAILGKKLHTYPALPRQEALAVAHSCNAVVCSSLNETFGLYIAEGMLMGHIVLRNDSAGREEQLAEGKNGFFIDSDNINQMADVFEKILNKKTLSNQKLLSMSNESREMMKPYINNKYLSKFRLGE